MVRTNAGDSGRVRRHHGCPHESHPPLARPSRRDPAHGRGSLLGRRGRRPLRHGPRAGARARASARGAIRSRPSTAARCRAPSRRRPCRSRTATACARSATAAGRASRGPRSRRASRRSTPRGRPIRSRSRPRTASREWACSRARCPSSARSSSRTPGQSVVVVSHKATLRILISSLLGFDARGYRDRLDQSPACLNVVDFKDPVRARLMLFNDVSHYQDHPRRSTRATCRSGGTRPEK